MMFWSKVDYLIQRYPQKFGQFVLTINDKIFNSGEVPKIDGVLKKQAEIFPEIFGIDFDGLEEEWREWVLDEYIAK